MVHHGSAKPRAAKSLERRAQSADVNRGRSTRSVGSTRRCVKDDEWERGPRQGLKTHPDGRLLPRPGSVRSRTQTDAEAVSSCVPEQAGRSNLAGARNTRRARNGYEPLSTSGRRKNGAWGAECGADPSSLGQAARAGRTVVRIRRPESVVISGLVFFFFFSARRERGGNVRGRQTVWGCPRLQTRQTSGLGRAADGPWPRSKQWSTYLRGTAKAKAASGHGERRPPPGFTGGLAVRPRGADPPRRRGAAARSGPDAPATDDSPMGP